MESGLNTSTSLSADARRGLLLLARLAGDAPVEEPTPAAADTPGFAWLASRRIDGLLDVNPLRSLYARIWRRQHAALVEAVTELERRGIEPLAFKGAEFHVRYFWHRVLGGMADVDVLVRRDQLEITRQALQELGFRHGYLDRRAQQIRWLSTAEVVGIEGRHYELAPLVRIEPLEVSSDEHALLAAHRIAVPACQVHDQPEWALEVGIDVHHGVATNIGGAPFFPNAIRGSCGAGLSMGHTDLLWFTLSRWYMETATLAKRSLREVAYVLPLFGEDLDWDVVMRAAIEYELGASLFYPLAFIERAFGIDIPAEVLDAADPRSTRRRADWGWQLGPLFDFIEPVPL